MTRTVLLAAAAWLAALATPAAAQTHYWSGFYAGVQAGLFNGTGVLTYEESDGDWELAGAFGGKFAGFNVQNGSVVWGVEADFNLASVEGNGAGFEYLYGSEVERFGSLRGRLGFASGDFLFFGTAGVAFAQGCFWYEYASGGDDYPMQEPTHVGVVIGAGAEYALTDAISIRKEVRFYNFPGQEVVLGTRDESADYALSGMTASIGIAYHF